MRLPRHLFSAAALFATTLVFAQTPSVPAGPADAAAPGSKEKALQLDVFTVTTTGDVGYLSTNAAEATRMNTPIENIPMNITVFNQQFIDDLLAVDSSEVIAFDASSVRRTENDGFLARGTASVGSTFLNGFAQTAGFGSQPLANIERIEVLRGPAAILFGSGGFGATYNRITKRAGAKPLVKFRSILSDEHGYRHELDYNAGAIPGLGDKLLVRVNGVLSRSTTWFGQRKIEQAIAPTLTWNLAPKTSLTLDYIYNFTETQASWETPLAKGDPHGFTFGDGTYHRTPRKTNWVAPEDFRRNTRTSSSADLRHAFTDNLQFRSQFQYETRVQRQQETVANGTTLITLRDTVLTGRYWRDIPRVTRTYRTRDELVWTGKTGPIQHRLLGGFAWDEQYDDTKTYQSAASNLNGTFATVTYAQFLANPALIGYNATAWLLPVNLFDRGAEPPVPAVAQRNLAPLTAYTRTHTRTNELYLNDVLSFFHDRIYVMAGVRKSHFERDTQNRRTGSGNTASIATRFPTVHAEADGTPASYGAVWHLTADKKYSVYANANTAFTPDFGVNPDGTGRDPNTGNQKEVGLKFNLFSGRIQGTASYFKIVANNNIADPDPTRLGYTIRQNGDKSDGFELNVNSNLTRNWALITGAAIIDSVDASGVAIPLQPKYKFSALNTYKFSEGNLKGLNLTLAALYNGERPLTGPFSASAQRNEGDWGPAPAWWRVDLVAGYKLRLAKSRLAWDFSVKIGNVFDNQDIYYVAAAHRYAVEQGRNWQASAGFRF